MAAKRYVIIFVSLAAIAAIAALYYSSNSSRFRKSSEDQKFARTYAELALAREIYGNNPDSLEAAFQRIFRSNGCDSTWMYNHLKKIADPRRYDDILKDVTSYLDSLTKASGDTAVDN